MAKDKFTPARSEEHLLDRAPVISPVFVETVALLADERVLKWWLAHAPAHILELQHSAAELHKIEGEFHDVGSLVVTEAVAACVNALVLSANGSRGLP